MARLVFTKKHKEEVQQERHAKITSLNNKVKILVCLNVILLVSLIGVYYGL